MTVLRSIFSAENPSLPLTSSVLADWLGGARSKAGVAVSEPRVLGLPAYYRALAVKAGTLAAVPLHVYEIGSRARVTKPTVLDAPNPRQTPVEFWMTLYMNAISWGNAYGRKLRDGAGKVVQVWPIHPSRVRVENVAPTVDNPEGKWFWVTDAITGKVVRYSSWEIMHLPYMSADGVAGISPMTLFRQSLGIAIAADDTAAKFFANGSRISGILQTKGKLDEPAADRLKKRWREKTGGADNAGDVAILDNGAEFKAIAIPPAEAQLLQSRQWSVSEIGRMVGLPPHLYGDTEKSTSWGTGIEQQVLGWVKFDLQTWITGVEQRVNKELLPGGDSAPMWYSKHALEGLLRGDSKARAEFYRVLSALGAISPNHIRGLEDWERVDGLDFFMVPKNMNVLTEGEDPDALDIEQLTIALQRIYLAVDTVITSDEAREILNRAGAGLEGSLPVPSA